MTQNRKLKAAARELAALKNIPYTQALKSLGASKSSNSFDTYLALLSSEDYKGMNHLVTGKTGSGKTYLLNHLAEALLDAGKKVAFFSNQNSLATASLDQAVKLNANLHYEESEIKNFKAFVEADFVFYDEVRNKEDQTLKMLLALGNKLIVSLHSNASTNRFQTMGYDSITLASLVHTLSPSSDNSDYSFSFFEKPQSAAVKKTGKIIAVKAVRGGHGASSATVLLASKLASLGHRVLALDYDVLDGTMGFKVNAFSPTLVHAFVGELSDEALAKATGYQREFNFDYMLSPRRSRTGQGFTDDKYRALLLELSNKYDYIIVDSPTNSYSSINQKVIEPLADRIVLVGTFSQASVNSLLVWVKEAKDSKRFAAPIIPLISRPSGEFKVASDLIESHTKAKPVLWPLASSIMRSERLSEDWLEESAEMLDELVAALNLE